MSEQDYIDYFADLATKNKAIRHQPDQNRFYVVHDNNQDELTKALKQKLRVPAVLLDQYYDDIDRTQDNPRLVIQGGISVLVKCNTSDVNDVRRARAEARAIARQFINRMYKHARTPGSPLYNETQKVSVSAQFQGQPTEDLAGYAGWGYPFELTLAQNVAVIDDDWDDLSPEPEPAPEPATPPTIGINQD